MAKRKQQRRTAARRRVRTGAAADFDSPWKEVLDRYFQLFLAFFFPEAHADIDWSRGYEMLDKELQKIAPQARHGRRYVDKLVKVWLTSGEETWLLIHIEIQTWREGDFAKRMHVYNYRIFDRYDHEVISLAILADDDPDWRPGRFGYERWGFRTGTEFPHPKLLDYGRAGKRWRRIPTRSPWWCWRISRPWRHGGRRLIGTLGNFGWSRGCTSGGWTQRTCVSCSGSSTGSWICRTPSANCFGKK
jgi:hypothetical protein